LNQLAFQHKTAFRGSCWNQMKRACSLKPLEFARPAHNLTHSVIEQLWPAVGSSDEHGLNGPFDVGFVTVRFGELKIAARFAANAGHDVVSAIFLKVINSAQTPTSRASRVG
jgi:hypothetical protein